MEYNTAGEDNLTAWLRNSGFNQLVFNGKVIKTIKLLVHKPCEDIVDDISREDKRMFYEKVFGRGVI